MTTTPNETALSDTSAVLAEFTGGGSSDVSMMIGIGLVKDTDAVFFQYLGEEQTPQALMLPSGRPLTRLANVRLAGVSIAEDIGEFNSTKLNLYLTSSQGRTVMLTSGLKTIWSQCILTGLHGVLNDYDLNETVFTLDTWKGTSKMRPCFGAIRTAGQKVSDQVMYELLKEARGNKDNEKVDSILRECVAALNAAVTGESVSVDVIEEVQAKDF